MTDEYLGLDESVLTSGVEIETLNFVGRVTANGDAMVVVTENLDELAAFEYD